MNAMLTKDIVREALDHLKTTGSAVISVFGSLVHANRLSGEEKVHLSTELYHSSGFIPFSVRSCIQEVPPIPFF